MIEIYTDGSCIGNPGPGSRGFIVYQEGKEIMRHRGDSAMTTNNQMELQAVIEALHWLSVASCQLSDASDNQQPITDNYCICTDSKYVYEGITQYIEQRKARNRRLYNKKPVKNLEQWKELDSIVALLPGLSRKWVKGHATDRRNNQVDKMIRV